jgi:hypothetical protein
VNPALRVLVAIALLALGAATGIATVFVHRMTWGLALGIAATAVTAYALPPGWSTRLPFVLGWVAMVGWLTIPRAEGDYLVSSDWRGYTLLGFGMVLLVTGLATLPRPRGRAPAAP